MCYRQPVVLGSMTEGAVMGDISFLQTKKQGGATATVYLSFIIYIFYIFFIFYFFYDR